MLHRIVQTFAQNVGSHNPVTASQLGAIVPPPVQTAVSHMDVQSPGPQPAQQLCVAPQLSGVGPQSALPQGLGVHMVVVDVVVVVVVVVVLSQTVPAPHTPEQQSKSPRQPWSPSGIQGTHIPVVVSHSDMSQVPQEPPQPSSPQILFAQFGVQPHWLETPPPPQVLNPVQVLPQLSVKPVQFPSGIVPQSTPARQVVGVQQVPKSGFAFPGGEAGFMQLRLQQLMFV